MLHIYSLNLTHLHCIALLVLSDFDLFDSILFPLSIDIFLCLLLKNIRSKNSQGMPLDSLYDWQITHTKYRNNHLKYLLLFGKLFFYYNDRIHMHRRVGDKYKVLVLMGYDFSSFACRSFVDYLLSRVYLFVKSVMSHKSCRTNYLHTSE
jgi:hypothetical protein